MTGKNSWAVENKLSNETKAGAVGAPVAKRRAREIATFHIYGVVWRVSICRIFLFHVSTWIVLWRFQRHYLSRIGIFSGFVSRIIGIFKYQIYSKVERNFSAGHYLIWIQNSNIFTTLFIILFLHVEFSYKIWRGGGGRKEHPAFPPWSAIPLPCQHFRAFYRAWRSLLEGQEYSWALWASFAPDTKEEIA